MPRLAGGIVHRCAGCPRTSRPGGIRRRVLIITGLYQSGYGWPAAIALIPIVIAAAYMLRLFQDVMNGPEQPDLPQRPDLDVRRGPRARAAGRRDRRARRRPGPLAKPPLRDAVRRHRRMR